MARNPIPGLSLPDPQGNGRPEDNSNALLRWSKTVSPRMLFGDPPAQVPPAPCDAFLAGGGRQNVNFIGGQGHLIYPVPFPNGILMAQVGAFNVTLTTPNFVQLGNIIGLNVLQRLGLYAWDSTMTALTANIPVDYWVIGF